MSPVKGRRNLAIDGPYPLNPYHLNVQHVMPTSRSRAGRKQTSSCNTADTPETNSGLEGPVDPLHSAFKNPPDPMILQGVFRCWSCRAEVDLQAISRTAVLRSRRSRDGGPFYVAECPRCRERVKLENDPLFRLVASPELGPSVHRDPIGFLRRPFSVVHVRQEPPDSSTRAPSPPPARPSGPAQKAYGILGLPVDADREAVEHAFRERAKRCHPDRFAHRDEESQRKAHRAFILIRTAYEAIVSKLDNEEAGRRRADHDGRPDRR